MDATNVSSSQAGTRPNDFQRTMRRIMLRMVAIEGGELASRRVPRAELVYRDKSENERVEVVLDRLLEARLVVNGKEPDGGRYVEPAHDALVRGWDVILNWTREEDEQLSLRRLLTPSAVDWHQGAGGLWHFNPRISLVKRQLRLAQTAAESKLPSHRDGWLNKTEATFVEASVQRFSRILATTVASIAIAIVILGSLLLITTRQNQALTESNERISLDNYVNQIVLAKQSLDLDDVATATATLEATDEEFREAEWYILHNMVSSSELLSSSGYWLDIAAASNGNMLATLRSSAPNERGSPDVLHFWDPDSNEGITKNLNDAEEIYVSKSGAFVAYSTRNCIELVDREERQIGKLMVAEESRERIVSFAFDSSEDNIAVAVGESRQHDSIRVLRVDNLEIENEFKIDRPTAYAIAICENLVAVAAGDGRIGVYTTEIWAKEGKKVCEVEGLGPPLAFLDSGVLLGQREGDLAAFHIDRKRLGRLYRGHTTNAASISISQDGKHLVSAAGTSIRIWDVESSKPKQVLRGHTHLIQATAVTDRDVISASLDGTIRRWPLAERSVLQGPSKFATDVAFNRSGTLLGGTFSSRATKIQTPGGVELGDTQVTGRNNDGVRIWNTSLDRLGEDISLAKPSALSWIGEDLALAGEIATLRWNPADASIVQKYAPSRAVAAYGEDILALADGSSVTVIEQGRLAKELGVHESTVYSLSFSIDGTRLLSTSRDGTVALSYVDESNRTSSYNGHHPAAVSCAEFHPSLPLVASGDSEGIVRIWNPNTLEDIRVIQPVSNRGYRNTKAVYTLAFARNGKRLASGHEDGTVIIWHPTTGKRLLEFSAHEGTVFSVAFHPTKRILATAGKDGKVRLWGELDASAHRHSG